MVVTLINIVTLLSPLPSCFHHLLQVYLSTRQGNYLITQSTRDGIPVDIAAFSHFKRKLPQWLLRIHYGKDFPTQVDQQVYGFDPKRSFRTAGIMINSDIIPRIASARIRVKPDIARLDKSSAILVDESSIEVDDVITCTGYETHFPFLDESIVFREDGEMMLYKRVFPPTLAATHPTLAFIGMIRVGGPSIPVCELQARWAASVLAGTCDLPSETDMLKNMEQMIERSRQHHNNPLMKNFMMKPVSSFYTVVNC